MKLTPLFLISVLAASLTLAIPGSRHRRRHGPRVSSIEAVNRHAADSTDETTSYDWAGAILTQTLPNQTFSAITGTFTLPTPALVGGPDITSNAMIMIAIDGGEDFYDTADIVAAGVTIKSTVNGSIEDTVFTAWAEWVPNGPINFPQFELSAGDVITINITASNSTSAEAHIYNHSTKKWISQVISDPSVPMLGVTAEWIVEDGFDSNGNQDLLANFASITFTDCVAIAQGKNVDLTTAETTDIVSEANADKLTSTTITNSSQVVVTYLASS